MLPTYYCCVFEVLLTLDSVSIKGSSWTLQLNVGEKLSIPLWPLSLLHTLISFFFSPLRYLLQNPKTSSVSENQEFASLAQLWFLLETSTKSSPALTLTFSRDLTKAIPINKLTFAVLYGLREICLRFVSNCFLLVAFFPLLLKLSLLRNVTLPRYKDLTGQELATWPFASGTLF